MKKASLLCFALLLLGLATAVPSTAARCCQSQCSTNSNCDRICGAGLGQCVQANSCCRTCVCSAT
ncbi:MAG TPA: hypothetical protein VHC97_15895 [Thermoanaerobaculia bacterium]|nr:hypothetical protein [Thermoanaerobaculia bacterium]